MAWLATHIAEMLQIDGFVNATLSEEAHLEDGADAGGLGEHAEGAGDAAAAEIVAPIVTVCVAFRSAARTTHGFFWQPILA